MGESQSFLLIGESNLARHVVGALELAGHPPTVLAAPDEPTLRHILGTTFDGIAVLTHDDVLALRYALSAAHWQPHTPLLATVFDHTVASRLREVLPQCVATSPADLAAPVLAGPCLADDILAACRHGVDGAAVVAHDGVPRRTPLPIQAAAAVALDRGICDRAAAYSRYRHPHAVAGATRGAVDPRRRLGMAGDR